MADKDDEGKQAGTIPQDILDAIRKKAFEEVGKYAVAAFVGLFAIAATGWWFYLKQNLATWAGGVPQDAVVVFDAIAECPVGWDRLRKAEGRYIVGAWPGREAGIEVGFALVAEENRPVGRHTHVISSGGVHTHSINRASGNGTGHYVKDQAAGDGDAGSGGMGPNGRDGVTASGGHVHQLEVAGDKDGTNAPYLTLLMCKKKRDV